MTQQHEYLDVPWWAAIIALMPFSVAVFFWKLPFKIQEKYEEDQ